jgi:hypothetical protein
MESEKLEERVNKLEAENRRLQSQMASYVPAVSVLNDCITSLEMQTLVHAKPHSHDYKESKVLLFTTINILSLVCHCHYRFFFCRCLEGWEENKCSVLF